MNNDMSLTAILGPMKSGKSSELIARVAPQKIAGKKIFSGQSSRHIRDNGIESRLGFRLEALPLDHIDISQVEGNDVIAIDEIHMFSAQDIVTLNTLRDRVTVIVSGLDLDYRGRLIPAIQALFELKPDEIIYKFAVCENCQALDAGFTQIFFKDGQPATKGLPPVVPEDGSYVYKAICYRCFQK